MWQHDDASRGLGMELLEVKPGRATLAMTIARTATANKVVATMVIRARSD